MDDETSSPGMDAIHHAMVALHGPQEPQHWLLDPALGMLGPRLEAVSAYDAGDHWHFVTLGLSNIWEKVVGDHPDVSGLGYEFTMRVRHAPRSRWALGRSRGQPPHWAVRFLQRLGDVTLDGARFRPGETLDPGGSITGDDGDGLVAAGFVDDPSLPSIDTPNGVVRFVQAFGMTAEELSLVLRGESNVRSFGGSDGLFVTDPSAVR